MMKFFQMLVFTAVMFSNIHWQWTPNGYVASLLGIGAAFCATWLLLRISSLYAWLRGPHQRINQRGARRSRA